MNHILQVCPLPSAPTIDLELMQSTAIEHIMSDVNTDQSCTEVSLHIVSFLCFTTIQIITDIFLHRLGNN